MGPLMLNFILKFKPEPVKTILQPVVHKFLHPKLHTMKITEEQLKLVRTPGVLILSDLFTKNGFEIRVAGGAVRDLLMGKEPKDLDFATTATPDEMKQMFEKEEIRMINSGGEKHGTITARIEEENFECTTLRIDKVTDGRHAEVEFIRDWKLDAGRRDLTINALFLGLDGCVHDYFDGISHLKQNLVKFVGDPDERMQEDYLRILRYFRFYGLVATDPFQHDPSILLSIQRNCHGLSKVSGERIWIEVKKIAGGRYAGELLVKMAECGVGDHIGLPKDFNCENVTKVYKRFNEARHDTNNFHPCTLLASGLLNEDDANHFVSRVKCSNKEKDVLLSIVKYRELFSEIKSVKIIQDSMVDLVYKDKKSKDSVLSTIFEVLKYVGRVDLMKDVNSDLIPNFPIKGGLLVDKVSKKNQIQKEMRRLLDLWKESNYTLSREELLDRVQT